MTTNNSLLETLRRGREILQNNGIDMPALCAELLLMHVTGLTKVQLLTEPEFLAPQEAIDEYDRLLNRCARHEPVQYLIEKKEFMSLDFYVCEDVLIPRPDTEILVEEALRVIKELSIYKKPLEILEVGTGSGCISISLAKYGKHTHITAIDISDKALAVALKNAYKNNVSIDFLQTDVFSFEPHKNYDLILSNPPYIPTGVIESLDENVRNYEPHLALDGGIDGLKFYRKITEIGVRSLSYGGIILFETGHNQSKLVSKILELNGYSKIWFKKDLAGIERVVGAFFHMDGKK